MRGIPLTVHWPEDVSLSDQTLGFPEMNMCGGRPTSGGHWVTIPEVFVFYSLDPWNMGVLCWMFSYIQLIYQRPTLYQVYISAQFLHVLRQISKNTFTECRHWPLLAESLCPFCIKVPVDVRIWKFETPRILSFNSEKDLNPFSTIIIFWEKIFFTIDVAMSSNIILT